MMNMISIAAQLGEQYAHQFLAGRRSKEPITEHGIKVSWSLYCRHLLAEVGLLPEQAPEFVQMFSVAFYLALQSEGA